jgi:hypothetical protein
LHERKTWKRRKKLELQVRETEAMREEFRRLDARERNAREALLAGIAAYLRALNGGS